MDDAILFPRAEAVPAGSDGAGPDAAAARRLLTALDRPCAVLRDAAGGLALRDGEALALVPGETLAALLPALPPDRLGSAAFRQAHGVRLACMAGAMANGIGSVELVTALGRAGVLAAFGAAGLTLAEVEAAVAALRSALPDGPWAVNLIHSPDQPDLEMALTDLCLRVGVTTIEASAFSDLAPAVVRFRAAGLARDGAGRVVERTRVVAKLSHPAVAGRFLSPPPAGLLDTLVNDGLLTREQAALAAALPVATDVTVEADSAGHTDGRPLVALLPEMLALRDRLQRRHGQARPVRLGAAGGIGTPHAAAAAFAMGADYVVTGSVNQACVEAGTSAAVRETLAQAHMTDVMQAPAPDMFELGVTVQVLKRGTLYGLRARRLGELYRAYRGIDDLPAADRAWLETEVFRTGLDAVWAETRAYWAARSPALLARAEADPHVRLGLLCRWYLGRSSDWARAGTADRRVDYQVWCGPAMGAFNAWTAGTALADPASRRAADLADAIMAGAAYVQRVQALRQAGVPVDAALAAIGPEEALAMARAAALVTPVSVAPVSVAPGPAPARTEPASGASAAPAEAIKQTANGDANGDAAPAAQAPGRDAIRDWLLAEIAKEVGLAEEELDPALPFESYAIDSARALVIMARLEKRLGRRLSPTLLWNYPTVDALAARLGTP